MALKKKHFHLDTRVTILRTRKIFMYHGNKFSSITQGTLKSKPPTFDNRLQRDWFHLQQGYDHQDEADHPTQKERSKPERLRDFKCNGIQLMAGKPFDYYPCFESFDHLNAFIIINIIP